MKRRESNCPHIAAVLLCGAIQSWACSTNSSPTSISPLPTLGGSSFKATGLNNAGQITGFGSLTDDVATRAFLIHTNYITELGTLGGSSSRGFAINASGQVVGGALITDDAETHAFLYNSGTMADLGTLGGPFSLASGVNDSGQVVGTSLMPDFSEQAFFYSAGSITNIGTLGGFSSSPAAINNAGTVVGKSTTEFDETHAFVYNGAITDLGNLGGGYSAAFGINQSGVIVGESTDITGALHAFSYVGGSMQDLSTLGGSQSSASAINNAGQIIGVSTILDDLQSHGFSYSGGVMTDLGTLGGDYSSPSALNNAGQVVGDSSDTNGDIHAFLWQSGTLVDLNSVLPTNSGWVLIRARFINDSGMIVGEGTLNGVARWYALAPGMSGGNNAPIAVAGNDQNASCQAPVTLDGSGSSDPDGDSLSYAWSYNGVVFSTNVTTVVAFAPGSHEIALTVSDACGGSSLDTVIVNVTDTSAPTVSVPASITNSVTAGCQTVVPNVVALATVSDDCTPSTDLVITQNPIAGSLVGKGQHNIVVTATDAANNSTVTNVTLNIVDNTPPVIASAPASLAVGVGANCSAAVPDVTAQVVATDNCGGVSVTQNPVAGTVLGKGQYTVGVTVTDESGNTASTNVTLNVVDTTAPVIVSAPSSLTVSVGANCSAAVPNVVSQVVASDNCGNVVVTQNPSAGTVLGKGQHTIVVMATDDSNNSKTANVTLNIVDTTAPVIVSAPSSLTVSVGANCSAAVPNVVSQVVASDNCGNVVVTQNPSAGTVLGKGQHTIVVTATDDSNNSTTANVTLNIVDTTAPVIVSAPSSVTISNCSATVPNFAAQVVATDNCGNVVVTQNPAAGTILGTGQYTIILTATDASNNSTTANVTVTVVGGGSSTGPKIVHVPSCLVVSVGENCSAAVPNIVTQVVATAGCGSPVITQSPAAGTILPKGCYTIVVTATDSSGRSVSKNVPLKIEDNTAPVVSSIAVTPSSVSASGQLVPVTVSVVASDNCDASPSSKIISITANERVSSGDIKITGALTAKLAAKTNSSTRDRVYTITVRTQDDCGNCTTSTVTVTVLKKNH